jgi:hypothetical protein
MGVLMSRKSRREDKHSSSIARISIADPDALFMEEPAAAFPDVATRTLQSWRQRGGGPQFVKISSRAVRYRKRDLIAWAEARLRTSTAG